MEEEIAKKCLSLDAVSMADLDLNAAEAIGRRVSEVEIGLGLGLGREF